MEYRIAKSTTVAGLMHKAAIAISEGWKPQGGLCAVPEGIGGLYTSFYQAFVRVDDVAEVIEDERSAGAG